MEEPSTLRQRKTMCVSVYIEARRPGQRRSGQRRSLKCDRKIDLRCVRVTLSRLGEVTGVLCVSICMC